MKKEVEDLLTRLYGEVPEATEGEKAFHEVMLDSGTFDEQQLKRDILRTARSTSLTKDERGMQAALENWNSLYPDNQYSNVDMLLGVEDNI